MVFPGNAILTNFPVSGAHENACSGISVSAEANEKANAAPRLPGATSVILLRQLLRQGYEGQEGYERQVDATLQALHWSK